MTNFPQFQKETVDFCKICSKKFAIEARNRNHQLGFCHIKCKNVQTKLDDEKRRIEAQKIKKQKKIDEDNLKRCTYCNEKIIFRHGNFCAKDCEEKHKNVKSNENWVIGMSANSTSGKCKTTPDMLKKAYQRKIVAAEIKKEY